MTVSLARGTGAAAVLIISAQGAFADVSAQDVWSDWKAYMTGTGYTVTGTESQSGNVLTVSDISMTMPLPDQDGTGGLTMPEIQFIENGDGTVNVMLPKDFPMTFAGEGDGEKFSAEILYSHDGSPMVVSGDTSAMTYDYATGQASLTLGKVMGDGEEMPEGALKASVMISDFTANTVMQIADQRNYTQKSSMAEVSYDIAFQDPDSSDAGTIKGSIQNITATGVSSIPAGLDAPQISDLIKAGMSVDAMVNYTAGNSAISVTGSDSFDMQSSSAGGNFGVTMSKDGLSYDVGQQDISVNVSGSEIPFPLALSMAETGFKLMMPVSQSDEEQDFGLGITLRDFAVPEMLWGMVDPTGALPHDPATIVLDLAGKGKLLFDMFDPEAMKAMERGTQKPGEFNALSIKQLLVTAAGAKLTGTGDFTFNNEDLVTFDGMPAPDGTANIELVGANGLIDNLIKMGLVSDSDAMGARMMMGMFGVPGEGEDTLTSEIKVTEDGQIHANGQRIK
ncbi:DUF2125 domain-containing protein [Pseudophaeobacter sp. EL27]|uniref:DUF2125 domain-containing protein n=1 Tax=Pseudophaeobacter sp. EL27 TaxID=2107580 RepID=UPI000EFB5739|nr:DUF2125 domain-containing protein [Pseudophaeobacter sp. EL27]